MSSEPYFTKTDDGALAISDHAWVNAESPGTYEISPGDVRDNTEYARKASASNRAEMYAARQLLVKYSSKESCPVLAVDGVRALGVAPKPDVSQRYGKDFIRLAFATPVIETLCRKVGAKIKLNSPPIEKCTTKDEYTIFTVGIPASCTLGSLVEAEGPGSGGQIEVVAIDREANAFCGGMDFEAACTFVLKAKYKGRTVPTGEIPGYTLVLEPCSITITEIHETMLDSSGSAGLPKVDLGTSAPTSATPSQKLVEFMRGLTIG